MSSCISVLSVVLLLTNIVEMFRSKVFVLPIPIVHIGGFAGLLFGLGISRMRIIAIIAVCSDIYI